MLTAMFSRKADPSHLSLLFRATEDLVWRAHKQPLSAADLAPLAPFMSTATASSNFHKMMRGIVWRKLKDESLSGDSDDHFVTLNSQEEVDAAIAEATDKPRLYMLQNRSLYYLIVRLVSYHFLVAIALIIGRLGTTILQIWALWTLIRIAMREENYRYSTGVQYVVALCLPIGATCLSFILQNAIHCCTRAGLISRSALTALLFEKLCLLTPLHLSETKDDGSEEAERQLTERQATTASFSNNKKNLKNDKKDEANASNKSDASTSVDGISSGQLINLLSSDSNTVIEGFIIAIPALFQMLDIAACIVWCGYEAGWVAAPLLGTVLIFIVAQLYCGAQVAVAKTAAAAVCDQRLRALTEFLSGIQVVKFYAWEANVRKMIYAIRSDEADFHVTSSNWKMANFALVFISSGVFAIVVFACKYTYDGDVMRPAETFLIMTLISYIMRGFAWLPRCLSGLATAGASLGRIQALLAKDVSVGLPTVTAQRPDSSSSASITSSSANASDSNAPFGIESDGSKNDGALAALPAANGDAVEMKKKQKAANASDRLAGLHVIGDFGWAASASACPSRAPATLMLTFTSSTTPSAPSTPPSAATY